MRLARGSARPLIAAGADGSVHSMANRRVDEKDLTEEEKGQRDMLHAHFGRGGTIITHSVFEDPTRTRHFACLMKSGSGSPLLVSMGCRLGGSPHHEGGASTYKYKHMLAILDSSPYTPEERHRIRAFIEADTK